MARVVKRGLWERGLVVTAVLISQSSLAKARGLSEADVNVAVFLRGVRDLSTMSFRAPGHPHCLLLRGGPAVLAVCQWSARRHWLRSVRYNDNDDDDNNKEDF